MSAQLAMVSWQPVLPLAETLPWHIALSWGIVVAALCWTAARAWRSSRGRVLAFVILVSAALPWTRGWTAYLALAFQTPSNVTLCACVAMAGWGCHAGGHRRGALPFLPLAGVLLGWGLWIDTFNRWPSAWGGASDIALYAWGFGAPALWCVVLVVFADAAWTWRTQRALTRGQQVVTAALLMFALTRWPTGNVWDALLDPWLWLLCHGCLLRSKYSCQKSTSSGE